MKSVDLLLQYLPKEALVSDSAISDEERVLQKLAQFFQNPEKNGFDMGDLLKLDKSFLVLAMRAICDYLGEDTYMLGKSKLLLLSEDNPLINQTTFASLLKAEGFKFDNRKFNVYYNRGIMPKEDIVIEGKPYWYRNTALQFINMKSSVLGYEIKEKE